MKKNFYLYSVEISIKAKAKGSYSFNLSCGYVILRDDVAEKELYNFSNFEDLRKSVSENKIPCARIEKTCFRKKDKVVFNYHAGKKTFSLTEKDFKKGFFKVKGKCEKTDLSFSDVKGQVLFDEDYHNFK